jgi:membrane-bound lytic murein transglycosylase C
MHTASTPESSLRHEYQRQPDRLASLLLIMLLLSACTSKPNPSPILPLDRVAEQISPTTTDDLLHDIQQDAERHLSVFCAQFWGRDNVWLPAKKQYTYYGEGWTSRGRMDFEAGEFQAQALVEPGTDIATALPTLRTIVDEAVEDRPADMARHDSTLRYAKRLAAKRGVDIEPVPVAPASVTAEPVLADIIEPGAAEHLTPSTLTSKPIIGSTGKHWTQVTYRASFKQGYMQKLAARYADQVRQKANVFHIPMQLIFAVIETESAFNPRATSLVPAYGLMQIVPSKAGQDAYHHVHGVREIPGPEFLYDPVNNINLGAAYLSLLDNNYLKEIENSQSRLYAIIAAYNTGAGNLARAFGTNSVRTATQKINEMSADAVYNHLREKLPYEETRKYLVKVNDAQNRYQNMFEPAIE